MAEPAWVRIQRKTFSRWCNNFLGQRQLGVANLDTDLADGLLLHNLLEILSNEPVLPKPKKATLKLQKVENINTCLRFIKSKDIKLVGIGAEDIHDGKTNLILGLIWTLILRFQIENFEEENDPGRSAKQALLDWCNKVLNPQSIIVTNFKDSWSDGRAFCGLVNVLEPGTVDLATRTKENAEENLNLAFDTANSLFQFPKVLDAVDVIENPDELSIMTYVSYFRAFLAANTADPSKTYAEGPGLKEAVSGKPAHYTVFAVNEEGTRATRGGANVKGFLADSHGKEVAKVKVKDNLNGTYECSYVPPHPGADFELHAQVGKSEILDSPFRPFVKPGEPKANKCVAHGPGLESAVSGEKAEFTVQTRDSADNPITEGGAKITATLHDPHGDLKVEVVDNHDGTYSCSYLPETAKTLVLDVKITTEADGEASIKNAPFKIPVHPGAPSAEFTEASGQGLHNATAGSKAPIKVQTKDKHGNPVKTGNAPIKGVLTLRDDGTDVSVDVLDKGDGTYELSYLPTKTGHYDLKISLDDELIKESPTEVDVKAGAPNLSNFDWECLELDGNGNRVLVAGKPDQFSITAKDGFGNPLASGGLHVEGALKGDVNVPVLCVDNGDGTYAVSYRPTVVGNYSLTVKVDGQPVGDASRQPIPIVVIPAGVSAEHTIAEGDGLEEAEVGEPNTFNVITRDEFDNPLTMGGTNIGGELVHEDGDKVPLVVVDNGDGTYTCTYPEIKKSGNYKVTPLVDGKPVLDAPFDLSVVSGGTNPDNTVVELPDHNVAGLPGLKVKLHDDFGNLQKKKNDKVRAHLLPLDLLEVDAHDNGDGTYKVDYPPDLTGDVEVKVKVNNQYAPTDPFSVTVLENPLPEEVQKEVKELLPSTGGLFNTLLKNSSPSDREMLLQALRDISHGKKLPHVEEPVEVPKEESGLKFKKPKREVKKAQINPIKARQELEEQSKEIKQQQEQEEAKKEAEKPPEEKPKYKPPPGAVGFGAIGNVAAFKRKEQLGTATAEQRGETKEVEGKAKEVEELKPEPAPRRGAPIMPGMGFGKIDAGALKAGLKKTNT